MTLINLLGETATEATVQDTVDIISELNTRLIEFASVLSMFTTDIRGALRVNVDSGTVTTVGNISGIGGFAPNQHMMALTALAEGDLTRNVVIS